MCWWGQWKYLYRAVNRDGDTVDFLLTAKRHLAAARRFLKRAIGQHGLPDKITIDKSGANTASTASRPIPAHRSNCASTTRMPRALRLDAFVCLPLHEQQQQSDRHQQAGN